MRSPLFLRRLFGRKPETSVLPDLLPLTPEYKESSHKIYLDAIERALASSANLSRWNWVGRLRRWRSRRAGKADDLVRNIALTGGYGVGKSSVLRKVADKHAKKVVPVSLSTLGDKGSAHSSRTDESTHTDPDGPNLRLPQQKRDNGAGRRSLDESKTNLIQKEIVKQLLYREEPVKMPGSRFRRIGRLKKIRALGIAALVALALVIVFYLSGWTAQLAVLTSPLDLGLGFHLILWAVFLGSAFAALALLHNRLQIRQLKVADTDVSLEKDAASYFDQYLDEIVYFFDVTKRDIVIFEDIDRFDDAHIFETLRALNTLLNGAGQLKGRRIRFIYAIKDSIFIKLGQLDAPDSGSDPTASAAPDIVLAEVERANRTKFFDLVIPVVPFITHRNARNLMDEILDDINGKILPELIDLAARHVTDMRLIKNVRNEFIIFKDKVLKSDDGDELDLSDDALFAMMLYKSTHLADFEKIKTGSSKLDDLYDAHGAIVSDAVDVLNKEAREKRRQLTQLTAVDARSRELAEALIEYAERIGRHIGVGAQASLSVAFAGKEFSEEEIRMPAFWRSFAASDSQIDVSYIRGGAQRGQISIDKAEAIAVFGSDLADAVQWDAANRAALQERLREIAQERAELSHSDWKVLIERDEYTDEDGKTFRDLTQTLDSKLARQLVEGGYLGRDFTLYTSSYYSGRVSTRAQNFLMHNVDRNVMRFDYVLEPADVKAIVQDRGDAVLREHGMYNISVLDGLLAPQGDDEDQVDFSERDRQAALIARSLMANGDDEKSFFDAYFAAGLRQDSLIRKLTAEKWPRVFNLVVNRSELDDADRATLFNSALESMADDVEYLVESDEIRLFVEEHSADLPVLTSDLTNEQTAQRIASGFARVNVQLASLQQLGSEVRPALVAINAYEITHQNLLLALESEDVALDQIQEANELVYNYVLTELEAYLAALQEPGATPVTIAKADSLAPIVADIVEADLELLPDVLAGAVKGAEVEVLANVPAGAWPALAAHGRFPITFGNVTAYMATIGEVDSQLAARLSETRSITIPEDADQSARATLAEQLLVAKTAIPDPAIRVALVASLGLDDWLPLASVPTEKGSLVGLLIEHEVIEDDAESFALALALDWPTREFAISNSSNFSTYFTTTELPIADVARLMGSEVISDEVKDVVLDRADEFVATDDKNALAALAVYSLSSKQPRTLPVPLVTRMASSGVGGSTVVRVLEPVLPQLNEAALSSILRSVGGDYLAISTRNGKRPRLPNTKADLALVQRLEALGVVNTHTVSGKTIKVNMKKP